MPLTPDFKCVYMCRCVQVQFTHSCISRDYLFVGLERLSMNVASLRLCRKFLFFFFFRDWSLFFYLFYFSLCWVFVSVRGLSLVVASGGHSSSRCAGLSLSRPLLLQSTGSRRAGSVVVAHGPSCSAACGLFPDQGSNPCALHQQADSQPLRHQGSPESSSLKEKFFSILNFLCQSLEVGGKFQSYEKC